MKQILLVKIDGIGDYLFFRLFWPQLAELGRKQHLAFDFLCAPYVLPLVEQYDRGFMRRIFCPCADLPRKKDRLRSLFPKYKKRYQKAWQYQTCLKENWDAVYSIQFDRIPWQDRLLAVLRAPVKGAVCGNNLMMGELERRRNNGVIYTTLADPPPGLFVLDCVKYMLEVFLQEPLLCPTLSLPFSRLEIRRAAASAGLAAGEEYIVFVPYTSSWFKNWDIGNFKRLAEELSQTSRLKIAVLGRTPPDAVPPDWGALPNVIDLVNKTPLDTAMKLAAGARYAVCTDTSLMHCALLGKAQCVCISAGLYDRMFMRYPADAGVRQKVFYPPAATGGKKGLALPDINAVSAQEVWAYIRANWRL